MATDEKTVLATPQAGSPSAFVIAGAVGYPFNIRGKGFGIKKGTVLFAGRQVEVTRWDDGVIKGFLPEDIQPGEVTVTTADGKTQKGRF